MSDISNNQPPPFILALDISKSCTGVCEGRAGERPRFYSIRAADLDNTGAMMKLGRWLIERTQIDPPDFIYYEAAVSPAAFIGKYDENKGKVRATTNPETTIALAKMLGAVELIAGMKHIAHRTAHVQTVRKGFLGHGRPSDPKKRVMAMCRALDWEPNNLDEADAGAVWWFATTQVSPRHYTPITPMLQAKVNSPFNVADDVRSAREACS